MHQKVKSTSQDFLKSSRGWIVKSIQGYTSFFVQVIFFYPNSLSFEFLETLIRFESNLGSLTLFATFKSLPKWYFFLYSFKSFLNILDPMTNLSQNKFILFHIFPKKIFMSITMQFKTMWSNVAFNSTIMIIRHKFLTWGSFESPFQITTTRLIVNMNTTTLENKITLGWFYVNICDGCSRRSLCLIGLWEDGNTFFRLHKTILIHRLGRGRRLINTYKSSLVRRKFLHTNNFFQSLWTCIKLFDSSIRSIKIKL